MDGRDFFEPPVIQDVRSVRHKSCTAQGMKTFPRFILLSIAAVLTGCANVDFMPYTGAQQNWPTASGAVISTKYAVPVYRGLPPRPYVVLGEVAAEHGQTWAWSDAESEALESAADEAKKRGGDAIIVQGSKSEYAGSVSMANAFANGNFNATAFGISRPVFQGKASVLVIKFKG